MHESIGTGSPRASTECACSDVAAFDGFWSFEFERRGAAEVVALGIATPREVDLPFRERIE